VNAFLRENYLKNSTTNFEKNLELPQKLVDQMLLLLGPDPELETTFKFLKNGLSKVQLNISTVSG